MRPTLDTVVPAFPTSKELCHGQADMGGNASGNVMSIEATPSALVRKTGGVTRAGLGTSANPGVTRAGLVTSANPGVTRAGLVTSANPSL